MANGEKVFWIISLSTIGAFTIILASFMILNISGITVSNMDVGKCVGQDKMEAVSGI